MAGVIEFRYKWRKNQIQFLEDANRKSINRATEYIAASEHRPHEFYPAVTRQLMEKYPATG